MIADRITHEWAIVMTSVLGITVSFGSLFSPFHWAPGGSRGRARSASSTGPSPPIRSGDTPSLLASILWGKDCCSVQFRPHCRIYSFKVDPFITTGFLEGLLARDLFNFAFHIGKGDNNWGNIFGAQPDAIARAALNLQVQSGL
jgi:hypothetical protein